MKKIYKYYCVTLDDSDYSKSGFMAKLHLNCGFAPVGDQRNRKGHERERKYARMRECFIHRERKNPVNGRLSRAQISTDRYLRAFLMTHEFSRLPFFSFTCLSQCRSFSLRCQRSLYSYKPLLFVPVRYRSISFLSI